MSPFLHAAGLGAANDLEERPDQKIPSMNLKLYSQFLQKRDLDLLTLRLAES